MNPIKWQIQNQPGEEMKLCDLQTDLDLTFCGAVTGCIEFWKNWNESKYPKSKELCFVSVQCLVVRMSVNKMFQQSIC